MAGIVQMVRGLPKNGIALCLVALLSVSQCLRSVVAQESPASQLLAVDLLTTGERHRIVLHLNQMAPYKVTPARKGQPLTIELVGCAASDSLEPKPATNALVRGVKVESGDGQTLLTFDLTTYELDLLDYTHQSEGLIIIDLRPRPGARTVPPTPAVVTPKTPAPTPRVSVSLPAQTPQRTQPPVTPSPTALVLALPSAKRATPSPAPRSVPSPEPTARPVALATPRPPVTPATAPDSQAMPTPIAGKRPTEIALPVGGGRKAPAGKENEIEFFGLFPSYLTTGTMESLFFSRMEFPQDATLLEDLRSAYFDEKVQDVYTLGARRGLLQRQPRESLEALVYLMAECYFRETLARWNSLSRIPADFPAAINHYEQATRYAPDSPLRPLGDYRLSQLYGLLGGDDRLKSQILLRKLADNKSLPSIQSSILYDLGYNLSLQLHDEHPLDTQHLDIAQKAFDEFLRQFPGDERTPLVLFLLGEIQYRRGNYARALDLMETATATNPRGRDMVWPVAMRAHMALAAQRTSTTLVNLATPSTRVDHTFREYLEESNDMATLMEYAKLLADAGNRKDAIRIYNRVAEMGKPREPIRVRRDPLMPVISEPKAEQTTAQRDNLYAARLAITRYALRDLQQTGQLAPDIPYDDYQEPIKALDSLLQDAYRLGQESELLREKALHLLALGKNDPARNAEALEMILPLLQPGKLPAQYARELRDTVWNIIPEVMAGYHRNGEDWLALRAFMTFREFLKDHPRRKEILLTCARIFLDANLRDHAAEVLDAMGPFEELTPEEQAGVQHLRRELLLDPKNPESLKAHAPALLGPGYDDATKARVLNLLGPVYAEENQHAYAAQVYLQGAALPGLPWQDRIEFYAKAASEYESALMYDKAFTIHLASIRALEEAGVATAASEEWVGNALMGMGENAQRIQDYDKAAKSYEQYLNTYPTGENAESARYQLGKVYEASGDKAKALEQYDTLSRTGKKESFWTRMARQSADVLRLQETAAGSVAPKTN